jgi:hypothetical protein
MVRQGVPHLRIGRRIRFSIPALQAWAAARIADSSTLSGVENRKAQEGDQSLATATPAHASGD